MATTLTAAAIRRAVPPPGKDKIRLPAGDNLHLLVRRNPKGDIGKYWTFIYTKGGTTRTMGLGVAEGPKAVDFREARDKADELLRSIRNGADPVGDRKREKTTKAAAEAKAERDAVTFWQAAEAHMETHRDGWKNDVHARQWEQTLTDHAAPLHAIPVAQVSTDDVLGVLQPIWSKMPETASRLRGRVEAVLDSAKVRGWRTGENPARWRGHLALMLPKKSRVRRVKHHSSLPWPKMPAFTARLALVEGTAARALEWTIYTACRTGEAINATWSEIRGDVWVVPAERTKTGKEHRVPLSAQALALLEQVKGLDTKYIFPGDLRDTKDKPFPISNMAMLMCLRRLVGKTATVHGFRSTFRDWCADHAVPREVAEAALAHVAGGVEGAYFRSDIIDRRREVMQAFADFATAPVGVEAPNVVPLKGARP
jgi:integrase